MRRMPSIACAVALTVPLLPASATKYERKASYLAAITETEGEYRRVKIGGKVVPEVFYFVAPEPSTGGEIRLAPDYEQLALINKSEKDPEEWDLLDSMTWWFSSSTSDVGIEGASGAVLAYQKPRPLILKPNRKYEVDTSRSANPRLLLQNPGPDDLMPLALPTTGGERGLDVVMDSFVFDLDDGVNNGEITSLWKRGENDENEAFFACYHYRTKQWGLLYTITVPEGILRGCVRVKELLFTPKSILLPSHTNVLNDLRPPTDKVAIVGGSKLLSLVDVTSIPKSSIAGPLLVGDPLTPEAEERYAQFAQALDLPSNVCATRSILPCVV